MHPRMAAEHGIDVAPLPVPARAVAALYALFATLALLLLVPLMPPFQNADEAHHAYRADQISHGGVLGRNLSASESGGKIDAGLHDAVARFGYIAFHRENKVAGAMYAPLYWGKRVRQEFSNTVVYPPVFYLPAAAMFAGARSFGSTVLHGLLAARLATGATTIALGAVAIALADDAAIWLFAVLLLPMSMALTAALSQDGPMLASTALAAALCRRKARGLCPLDPSWGLRPQTPICLGEDKPGGARFVGTGRVPPALSSPKGMGSGDLSPSCEARLRVTGSRGRAPGLPFTSALFALVAMARPPYAAFALVLLGARTPLRNRLMCFGAVMAATLGWALLNAGRVHEPSVAAIDPMLQLQGLLHAPWRFVAVLAQTWDRWGGAMRDGFIGELGWLDVELPEIYRQLAWLMLALALGVCLRAARLRTAAAALVAAAILGAGLGVAFLQYLTWSLVGASAIGGVQGRYFLAPALLIAALPPGDGLRGRWVAPVQAIVLAFPLVGIPVTVDAILLRYYI